jgi:dTDP-4-dehydrorhamnose reductase/4-ketoreductase
MEGRMRILVTGSRGCLGRALVRAGLQRGHDVVGLDHAACDVTDPVASTRALAEHRPDRVLFGAAYTAVDRCAEDPRSVAVNVQAPRWWAGRVPTWWVSTNYVFHDGGPHSVDATLDPRGVYARQKALGEAGVLAEGGHVARVGWVLGPGGRSFGSTVVGRLRRGECVTAIHDVVIQPTWSADLAAALVEFPEGISHHIGAGETSWYGLALAVRARVGRGEVVPARQDDIPFVDPRPRDARLAPATLRPWWEWVDELAEMDP